MLGQCGSQAISSLAALSFLGQEVKRKREAGSSQGNQAGVGLSLLVWGQGIDEIVCATSLQFS